MASETGITGTVQSPKECLGPVMVWLSLDEDDYQKRLLLMHTQVPQKGSFEFFLRPGKYQLRASDEKGCEFFKKVTVGNDMFHHKIVLVKK
jgi:hypothetical protein